MRFGEMCPKLHKTKWTLPPTSYFCCTERSWSIGCESALFYSSCVTFAADVQLPASWCHRLRQNTSMNRMVSNTTTQTFEERSLGHGKCPLIWLPERRWNKVKTNNSLLRESFKMGVDVTSIRHRTTFVNLRFLWVPPYTPSVVIAEIKTVDSAIIPVEDSWYNQNPDVCWNTPLEERCTEKYDHWSKTKEFSRKPLPKTLKTVLPCNVNMNVGGMGWTSILTYSRFISCTCSSDCRQW